jgi:hypothetical protein
MSTPYTGSMTQEATYWPPGLPDGFGGLDFAASVPVLIACRWQDDAALFRDAQGREVTSSAVVYVDRELAMRGCLALGDHTALGAGALQEVAGAFEIRQVGKSPSLSGWEALHKVYL